MKGKDEAIAELENLLKFDFFDKTFNGVGIPIDRVEFTYDDNGKLIRTLESLNEETPVVSEYIYDDNGNCTMTKSYKSGLTKPKDSDIVIGISKYDDQNRIIYINSPVCERTITYIDDNTTAIKEVSKMNSTITTRMVNKDGMIIHELVSVDGTEQYELYRDYESESAKEYNGYDEVKLEMSDEGKLVDTSRTTYDDKDRVVKMVLKRDNDVLINIREYCEDHPDKLKHETVTVNGQPEDDVNYEYDYENDQFTITGKYRKVTREKADNYYIVKYIQPELKHEVTTKIIDLSDKKSITILYNTYTGNVNAVEYVDDINENVFAYRKREDDDTVLEMVDCDIKFNDIRFTVNKDITDPTGVARYIYQKFNEDDKIVLQDTIMTDSKDLPEYINSLVLDFIKSEGLDEIIFKEGGINVTEQFNRIGEKIII